MALTRGETKRPHSWLWDSHISPKNSKWLQENLSDMDSKVKAMFKLINEDADSFAKKAEMYYKRRPELTRLIEEFFRAYRALAERYVHATRALKQAHRTMAEAFPNQIPPIADDSPAGSVNGEEPRTPEGTSRGDSDLDSFTSDKDDIKKNGSNDFEFLNIKKGLRPVNESFSPGTVTSKVPGTGARKEPSFEEDFEDAFEKAKKLQEKISKLTSENDNLMEQVRSETQNSTKVQSEVQMLKAAQSKLILEKEDALRKFQECLKKVIDLEAELKRLKKVNDELVVKANRSDSADEIYHLLKEENESLHLKVRELEQKSSEQQEELSSREKELEKLKISVQEERSRSEQVGGALGSLEKLHSEAQEKLKASSLEMQNGVNMLKDIELKKHALEKDIIRVKEENANLNKEVKQKQEELEKLNVSLQNELARSMQAEAALKSLEKLHAQSLEELQQLISDTQSKVYTLNDLETRKQGLEEELAELKEEIKNLHEQNISSRTMIQILQDEISSLKEANHKMEAEVRLHVEGKGNLQKELHVLKVDMNTLQEKHQEVTAQMQTVGMNEQSFQTSVIELQEGNLELRETCMRQETENILLLEKLEQMEKISDKNANLEVSLLGAHIEIDELRGKVNALQISYEALNQQQLELMSERNSLAVTLGSITENMGKLLESNTFLENSVSDANFELEELRGKMKILEEASQVLHNDNSNLQGENNLLLSQVDLIGRSLESLEKKYVELHDKHSNLEREKESTQKMLTELSELSKLEKQQHEGFRYDTNTRLSILENQINLLHQDNAKREEKYREEQFKLLAAHIETFILEQSLCDLRHGNMSLAKEHHKLEKHIIGQEGKMLLMLELIGRMRKGVHKVLNALFANEDFDFSDAMEESCWQFILNKVKEIQDSVAENEDEKIRLQIENSINATLIQQLGSEILELKSDKASLETDCQKRTTDLLILQAEQSNLLGVNEQLKQDLLAGSKREDALEKEMDNLRKQLLELKDLHFISEGENIKLLQKSQFLSSELGNLQAAKASLEEEIRFLLQEFVNVDCLSLIFEQLSAERAIELKKLIQSLRSSHESNKDLERKVQEMAGKIQVIEEENFKLKEYMLKSEECKSHLTVTSVEGSIFKDVNDELNYHIAQLNEQVESGGSLLVMREKELSEAHVTIVDMQHRDEQMHHHLESTLAEAEEAKSARDGLQQEVFSLSSEMIIREKDITHANEINEVLHKEVLKLSRENESLRAKEDLWTSNLLREVEKCESEVATLCSEIQETTVHVAVFEDKIQELMGVCEKLEIKSMVERTTLNEEMSVRNEHIQSLSGKLFGIEGKNDASKSESDEYLPIISSLRDRIYALESYLIPSEKYDSKEQMQAKPHVARPCNIRNQEANSKELTVVPVGVLELKRLLAKVEAIQGALDKSSGQLVVQHADLGVRVDGEGPEGEIVETSNSNGSFTPTPVKMDGNDGPKYLVTPSNMLSEGDELQMKDIPLDQVSSSSKFETDDGLDGMVIDGNRRTENADPPPFWSRRDTDNFHSEPTEEKNEYPSSGILIDRLPSVDKLEVPKKVNDPQEDWRQEIIQKLKSDSHRLIDLETNMENLTNRIEQSEKNGHPMRFDFNSVKEKLQETNKDMISLAEMNRKLTKKAEDCSSFSEGTSAPEDLSNLRKVSGRSRRVSERIGRLELELQKIQYILQKIEEEQENQNTKSSTRRKVLLRDYLYGRSGDGNRKKSLFSWCTTRPPTREK